MRRHVQNFVSSPWLNIVSLSLVMLCAGAAVCYQLYHTHDEGARRDAAFRVWQGGQTISVWLRQQTSLAVDVAGTPAARVAAIDPDGGSRSAVELLEGLRSQHPEWTMLAIVSFREDDELRSADVVLEAPGSRSGDGQQGQPQQNQIVRPDREPAALMIRLLDGVLRRSLDFVRREKQGVISDVLFSQAGGLPAEIVIAVPVREQGRVVGAVVVGVDMAYLGVKLEPDIRGDFSGRFELLDSLGRTLTVAEPGKLRREAPAALPAAVFDRLHQGELFFEDAYGGETWRHSVTSVDMPFSAAPKWWLLLRQTQTEALAGLLLPLGHISLLSLLLVVVVVLLIVYHNRTLARALTYSTRQRELEIHSLYTKSVDYGIIQLDREQMITDANPAILRLLDYQQEDLIGKNVAILFAGVLPSSVSSALGNESQSRVDGVVLWASDGEYSLFDMIFTVVELADASRMTIITLIPVPETREYEERMQAIYSASPDAYVTLNRDHELVDCTDSCIKLFGVKTKQDMREYFSVYSAELQADGCPSTIRRVEYIAQALRDGSMRFPWLHTTAAGELFPCEVTLIRFQHRGDYALMACIRDLREQKRYEVALARERALLRNILDKIPGIIFLTDAAGRYVTVNHQFMQFTRLPQEEILGKTDPELLPPEFIDFCLLTDQAARDAHGAYYFEQLIQFEEDASPRDYLFSKEALYTSEGAYDGILGVGIDVSKLKDVERQLAIAKSRAEEGSQAKTAFLSTISHEIRTPMNAIVGFVTLFDRANLTPRQIDYLDKIRLSSGVLLNVINSVLEVSKIESGKMELEHVPFRLREVLEAATGIASLTAHEKGLDLVLDIVPETPEIVVGDPARISQILLNLINNAVKFTERGSVCLHVRPEPAAEAQCADADAISGLPCFLTTDSAAEPVSDRGSASCPAWIPDLCETLVFEVTDTGIGMTPEQIERIFQPFTQADTSITRKYGGTGLGLTICKQLAEKMRGTLSVASVPGQGTQFSLLLPLQSGTEDMLRGCSPARQNGEGAEDLADVFTGQRVLLVEDNLINQEIALALLEPFGFAVDTADNGAQAVAAALVTPYVLIVMDVQMPVMDGLTATRILREHGHAEGTPAPWLRTVPIIAMTANALAEDRIRCLEAGMDDHIPKPLDPAVLRATLCRHLVPIIPA